MSIKSILTLLVVWLALGCAVCTPVDAATTEYRLQMWIAPLECTRSEIIDGVSTTIILSPRECDDLLHPPVKPPVGTVRPGAQAPRSPNTGVFSDVWTTGITVGILGIFITGIIVITIRDIHFRTLQKQRR